VLHVGATTVILAPALSGNHPKERGHILWQFAPIGRGHEKAPDQVGVEIADAGFTEIVRLALSEEPNLVRQVV